LKELADVYVKRCPDGLPAATMLAVQLKCLSQAIKLGYLLINDEPLNIIHSGSYSTTSPFDSLYKVLINRYSLRVA
jgi:hypothetical protein